MKWNAPGVPDGKRRSCAAWMLSLLVMVFAGCANTVTSTATLQPMDARARWALLPMTNNTEAPMAGLAAEAMVEHHLMARGISPVHYPASVGRDLTGDAMDRSTVDSALKWAREQGLRYAVTGSVEEWRYKAGLDGEPAVGLTLRVVDLESGQVVWTASGSRAGWGRDSVSSVSQILIQQLVTTLPVQAGPGVPASKPD